MKASLNRPYVAAKQKLRKRFSDRSTGEYDYYNGILKIHFQVDGTSEKLLALQCLRDATYNNPPHFMAPYIRGKHELLQDEATFNRMTGRQISTCKETILLHGEQWRPITDFPGRFISNYGRIIARTFHKIKTGFDGRLKVALEDQRVAQQRTLAVRWLDSLVHQHFVRNDVQPDEILYLVHQDDDQLNNMVSNLIPMSYTEYHQYKQESLQDGETEWRHVRVANPVYYINPYFNTTQAQYSVSKHGQVITKAGELFKVHPHTRGKRVELFINGEKQFVFISKIMLDSFGDWDFERDYPYPIDNNYQSLEFSSWVQGTLKEARDHLIQYLETQNPGERFKPIGKLKHGVHDRYLVSSQGKVFSMWRNAFMALDTEDPYTSVHLQGKDYDLGRLVYGAFIGEIPIGYNVCRGYAGETYADQLRLSNTNEVRDEALKKASSTFNLTDIDEQAEVWKPMNRGRRIYRRLEGNVEVSSEGRVKINGSLLTQHKINGYLLIHYDGHYYFVHRMVAATFIPNPDPHKYKIVNHMSRDRTCNKIWNLEWVSASENSAHAWGIPIEVIDERDGNAESFLTLRAVCKRFKIGRATLVKRIEDGQLFRGYYRAVALKRQQSIRKQDGAVHIAHQDNDEDSNQEQIENTGSTAQLSLEFDDDGEFDEIDSSDEECVFGSDVEETEGDHLVVEDVFEYRTQEEEKNSLYEENYQQDDSSSIDISQQIDIDAVAHYLGETSLYDEESMQLLEDMPVLAHDYSISYDDYRHSGEDDNSKENESESEDNKSSMDDSPNRISMNEDEEEDEEDTIRYKYKRHSIWDTSEDSGTDSEDKESTIVHVVDATVAVDIFSESEDNIGETINYKQKRNHSLDTSEESD